MTPAAADDSGLLEACGKLRETDADMWLAVRLVRFAGLRQGEIQGACAQWMVRRGAAACIEFRDREENQFWTKTGEACSALILSAALIDCIAAMPPEARIRGGPEAERWLQPKPQPWLKLSYFL